ncbi:hypothetical protein [Actinospica sp.]|jgi:hypothetical protein|uniref:hypothetical protein n=1 Tax=Actinospica sp. TaxID=1872142 RepID=UPI002B599ED8|nr:hypothetical protein [Actinospica sp.]HWG25552.1 hypothetical protein [Actinospica sp.]
MRRRTTGLLLALILLVAAVPAVLECCFHAPDRDAHAEAGRAAVVQLLSTPSAPSTRGCVDQAGPTQNPYIETASGSGGGTSAASRSAEATIDDDAALSAAIAYYSRHSALAADSTGPPLWLSTCVSRT